MKIAVLSRQNEYAQKLVNGLKACTSHEYVSWVPEDPAPAHDFDGFLTAFSPGDRAHMTDQPKLGFIQTASAGYEAVDVEAATEMGIWVSYSPSGETGNAISVAEHTLLLMLGVARHVRAMLRSNEGHGARPIFGLALEGKHVCILGLGGIGHELAKRLRPFGVSLSAVVSKPEETPEGIEGFSKEDTHKAIAQADFTVLCVPATAANENMVDAAFLAAMKPGAILINVARGVLVDEQALLASVQSGHLAGAGLDVVRDEPVKPDNALLSEPSIFITPHLAGATDLMMAGTVEFLAKAIGQYASGERPDSLVNEPATPRLMLRK